MRKKFLITVGIVLILTAIAVPSTLLANVDSLPISTPSPTPIDDGNITITLENAIAIDFGVRYGFDIEILDIVEPNNEFIIYWQSETEVGVIRWTDGLWVELMNIPLQSQETQQEVE